MKETYGKSTFLNVPEHTFWNILDKMSETFCVRDVQTSLTTDYTWCVRVGVRVRIRVMVKVEVRARGTVRVRVRVQG